MTTAKIYVTLKDGILDPQGKTVQNALHGLGIGAVKEARVGKLIKLDFGEISKQEAQSLSDQACKKLLANPVIEDYQIDLIIEDS